MYIKIHDKVYHDFMYVRSCLESDNDKTLLLLLSKSIKELLTDREYQILTDDSQVKNLRVVEKYYDTSGSIGSFEYTQNPDES